MILQFLHLLVIPGIGAICLVEYFVFHQILFGTDVHWYMGKMGELEYLVF